MKRLICFSFIISVFAVPVEPSYANQESLSLSGAISYAIEHSVQIKKVQSTLQRRLLESDNSTAQLFPLLDLTLDGGAMGDSEVHSQSAWGNRLSLSLTENIYDNGKTLSQRKIQKLKYEQALLQVRLEKEKVTRDTALEFLSLSALIKTFAIQKEQFAVTKKQYESAESNFRVGLGVERDVLRFKAQMNKSEIDLLNMESDIQKSKEELRRIIGISPQSKVVLDFIPEEEKEETAALPNPDLTKHLEYRISATQRQIDTFEADITKRANGPELSLSSGITYQSTSHLPETSSGSEWNALLSLKYNIWDWGTRERNRQIAEINRQTQSDEIELQLQTLSKELSNLITQIDKTKRGYKLSKELLSLEEKNFQRIQNYYQQGKSSYLDLTTALANLTSAKSQNLQLLFELKKNQVLNLYHRGELYDFYVK